MTVMAKVLVTGASGFIGAHLVRELVKLGNEVTCLVRKSSSVASLTAARLVQGDITDAESLKAAIAGQDVVYQLAGCLRALHPEQLYRVNEDGVRNVAQTCAAQSNPPTLIVVSSLAAAGPAQGDRPRTEGDPPAPVSNYGRSKRAGEQAAAKFAGQVPITIVRPPIVFGEADPAMREVFSIVARYGFHLVPGWSTRRFSIIHADDLVHLMILAAQRGKRLKAASQSGQLLNGSARQGIYFVACEENPTYAELGRLIGVAVGRHRVLVLPTGKPIVWMVAGVSEAISHIRRHPWYFDLDKAREATAGSWICSPQAAIEELKFSVAAPLPERLHQTAQWYRKEGWL
jgi:nucleoside-diphosphate-sugar epimerase